MFLPSSLDAQLSATWQASRTDRLAAARAQRLAQRRRLVRAFGGLR
jgi:hypothetical protein